MKIQKAVLILAFLFAGCSSPEPGVRPESTSIPREDGKGINDPRGVKEDSTAIPSTSDKKEAEIVFRCEGGTETVYLVFREDGCRRRLESGPFWRREVGQL